MKTYIVKYEIHLNDRSVIRDKEMKVKRCSMSVEAQCKLEKYLKKKYDNFSIYAVIFFFSLDYIWFFHSRMDV